MFPRVSLCFVLCVTGVANVIGADDSVVAPRPSNGRGGKAGTYPDETIHVNGANRAFRLVVPKTVDLSKPVALVFAFHGFLLDSKDNMPRYTRFSELAEREAFVVVYPAGTERRWRLRQDQNRDIEFFDQLYDHLTARYNIDLNRVYLTGMSNGAYFINLLAAKRSEKIAAAAPHSGGLGALLRTRINAKHKYPVMIIHGDLDQIVPVKESRDARDKYRQEGHSVKYVEIDNLRHFWASHANINDQIWTFFESHPMKSAGN